MAYYHHNKAARQEEVIQEITKLQQEGKKITAKWDCGGDDTIVTLLLGEEYLWETHEKLCEELKEHLINKLSLPNTGECYNEGKGWIEQDEYGQVYLCYTSLVYNRGNIWDKRVEHLTDKKEVVAAGDYLGKSFKPNYVQHFSITLGHHLSVLSEQNVFRFSGNRQELGEEVFGNFVKVLTQLALPYFEKGNEACFNKEEHLEPQVSFRGSITRKGIKIKQVYTDFIEITEKEELAKKLLIGYA